MAWPARGIEGQFERMEWRAYASRSKSIFGSKPADIDEVAFAAERAGARRRCLGFLAALFGISWRSWI